MRREAGEARRTQQAKSEARGALEAETGKKARGRKPQDPEDKVDKEAKDNATEPDSRIMKTRSRGYIQGYNGQAMVDAESQVIVDEGVTQEENGVKQLAPMMARCQEQAGAMPDNIVNDAGYWSEANAKLETPETTLYIAAQKDWKQRKAAVEAGEEPPPLPENATVWQRMEHRLRTEAGRAMYKPRGQTVEPGFGQMMPRGLLRFVLRGIEKVRLEWSLWCSTHNLLKLWRRWLRASKGGAAPTRKQRSRRRKGSARGSSPAARVP